MLLETFFHQSQKEAKRNIIIIEVSLALTRLISKVYQWKTESDIQSWLKLLTYK